MPSMRKPTASASLRKQSSKPRKCAKKPCCAKAKRGSKAGTKNLNFNKRADKHKISSDKYLGSAGSCEDLRMRKRWKTLNEREVLEWYYELDSDWTRKTIVYVQNLVQLSEKQIYKWGYEKRRRLSPQKPEEKAVNMSLITKAEDLALLKDSDNFNCIIADLFPEEKKEEETLSKQQRETYDRVRDKLLELNEKYERQSDLDKLLNDRIPIKGLALEAKSAKRRSHRNKIQPIKSVSEHSQATSNTGSNEVAKMETCDKYNDCSEWVCRRDPFRSRLDEASANILGSVEDCPSYSIDPDSSYTCFKESSNVSKGKRSVSSEEYQPLLESQPEHRLDVEPYSILDDGWCFEQQPLGNKFWMEETGQICQVGIPFINIEDTCKYENLNELCHSLLSSRSCIFDHI